MPGFRVLYGVNHSEHRAPAGHDGGEGCLTTLIRIPVRIVVLVLVLPVRMAWDLLTAAWRGADRILLRPLGRGLLWLCASVLVPLATAVLVRPWGALWRYLLVPVARYGIAVPLVRLYTAVLTPAGHALQWAYRTLLVPVGQGVAIAVHWVVTVLFVWPVTGLWRHVLTPIGLAACWLVRNLVLLPLTLVHRHLLTPLGHGILWLLALLGRAVAATGRGLWTASVRLATVLLVIPLGWVYRRILTPVGREIAAAVGVAWRVAGYVSRAVGRALARLAWILVGAPVTWAWRTLCVPTGRFVRDVVWAPARIALRAARESVRAARRDAWRALVGPPQVKEVRELGGPAARTLDRTTTVPSAAPAPEISPFADKTVERR